VKVWDLERAQGGYMDIVMKPQSLIYDIKGSQEYFFGKDDLN
jgi:hypothetical protein